MISINNTLFPYIIPFIKVIPSKNLESSKILRNFQNPVFKYVRNIIKNKNNHHARINRPDLVFVVAVALQNFPRLKGCTIS